MNKRNRIVRYLVIAGITLAAATQTVQAALLAQDAFVYPITNSTVVGQGSNSNWPTRKSMDRRHNCDSGSGRLGLLQFGCFR